MKEILFVLGFGTAFSLLGDATLYAVLPIHTTEAGISLAVVGLLLGINRAVRVVFNGIAGWLADQWSPQRLFLWGIGIGACSTACYAIATEFWLLLIGRIVWGMAWSCIWVGGSTMLLELSERQNRGRWTGIYQTWFFLGAGLGALLGGVLTDLLGYHRMLWVITSLQWGSVVLVFRMFPSLPVCRKNSSAFSLWRSLTDLLNRDFCLTVLFQGVNRFCISGMLSATLGLLVKERLGAGEQLVRAATWTGILLAGRTLVSMASAPLAGYCSDQAGDRWKVMAGAFLIGGIAMGCLARPSLFFLVIGVLLSAIMTSSVQSLTMTLTADLVESAHRGKAISVLQTVGDIGSALGPPCAYAILFRRGLTSIYWLCGGLFLLAFGLLVLIKWRFRALPHSSSPE